MGLYLNPRKMSKEQFLLSYGTKIPQPASWLENAELGLVCLLDNRIFTAAAVMFNVHEFKAFTDVNDHRPRTWYLVPMDRLREEIPEDEFYRYFPQLRPNPACVR